MVQCLMMGERRAGKWPVRYYVLVERQPGGRRDYGLRLAMPDGESAEVRGITGSGCVIRWLLRCLMRGVVTPVSLRDVVEDWLVLNGSRDN